MKVKELIKELHRFDPNQDVYLQQLMEDGCQYSVASDGVLEQEVIDMGSKIPVKLTVITIDNKAIIIDSKPYELTDE